MRVEKRTVSKTVLRFIAEDGEEFICAEHCLEHERLCKVKEVEERIVAIPHFDMAPPFANDNEEWRWYHVRNQKELEDIQAALFSGDSVAHDFKPESFPCWIAAILDKEETGTGWMLEYSDYVSEQKRFDRKLAAEIERLGGAE